MIMRSVNQYSFSENKRIKEIEAQIKEEKMKDVVDKHKIYRLEEQKLINGLFSNDNLCSMYGKYKNPW